jgi:hypothetical protein
VRWGLGEVSNVTWVGGSPRGTVPLPFFFLPESALVPLPLRVVFSLGMVIDFLEVDVSLVRKRPRAGGE